MYVEREGQGVVSKWEGEGGSPCPKGALGACSTGSPSPNKPHGQALVMGGPRTATANLRHTHVKEMLSQL